MLNITLEQISAFLSVVRYGNISKAAHAISLTQPAVSSRIKNLEAMLGTELFQRGQQHAKLTKAGEKLFHYSQSIENLVNGIERDIADPALIDSILRIGASETIAQTWLPDFISLLYERLPRLQIEYHVDISSNLRSALLSRDIDLALLLGPLDDPRVTNLKLPHFELDWYTSALTAGQSQTELKTKPILTYGRGTRPYFEIQENANRLLGPNAAVFPSSSLSATLKMVEQGLGVAAIPVALAKVSESEGRLKRFQHAWQPSPLIFTISYLAESPGSVLEKAAGLAQEVAETYHA